MARPVLRRRAYGVALNPTNETEGPMWAQLISTRLKPGKDQELPKLFDQLEATEQPGSGLLRSTAFRDQKDPTRFFTLVIFESEEKARAREQDPRRQEGLAAARAAMAEIFDGAPEFVDLTVINDFVP
jgi:quinol monooxygenase YgiN